MLDINKYSSRYDCCVEKKILSRKFRQKATQKYFLENLLPFQYVAIFNSDGMIQMKINAFRKLKSCDQNYYSGPCFFF